MTHDIHAWRPVIGECAAYDCSCGATGYRLPNGRIVPHKTPRVFQAPLTAQPSTVESLPDESGECDEYVLEWWI
jgi:hypothetical protein